MYTPAHFQIDDRDTLNAFMRQHSFATIVTHDGKVPHATHMPVLLNPTQGSHGCLLSHMARANPQWRHFTDSEVLVIFTGPHAYISPAWYATEPAVPTWNYTAVHAYGIPRIVTQHDRFSQMLHDLVEFYEAERPNRWHGTLPPEFRDGLMKGIVGIEIEITRLEGKFKLSQNRPQDIPRIITALETSPDQTDRDTAKMMKQQP
ncbi:MAG: FMN-binding negative transcriptional regulator [Prosthecobacter sp.]|uniref:FMN-binding negative transcriptional regulator n=1 Tax=Prosthecobacter sp. TaxID=1965333 RepID=UPI002638B8D7|nr:FMN-binding negative transcriptional regulator [Prosthecobacter sp.]MCF7788431.1 FMN-binding negative transcriptional regulator [Prosthecobacter sp.]